MECFATCPTGFERLLANELTGLRAPQVRPLQGQVAFSGSIADAYRVCLWSRLASRVVVVLGRCAAHTSDELYEGVHGIAWEDHLMPGATFAVDASGSNAQLKSTQYTALRAKDAIADRLSERWGSRADVDAKHPDVRVVVRISREKATIGLDLAKEPLFERGKRRTSASKGLRADYAAALLALAGWQDLDFEQATLLALAQYPDTILVEAASVAACQAPGLLRSDWGHTRWAQHDKQAWDDLVEDARSQRRPELAQPFFVLPLGNATSRAASILRSRGIVASVRTVLASSATTCPEVSTLVADLSDVRADDIVKEATWLRVLAQAARAALPAHMVVASRDDLPKAYVGCEPQTSVASMLGREALSLQLFNTPNKDTALPEVRVDQTTSVPVLVPASDQFAARLKKVSKQRAKWARREDVSCYRIYDADLPDYAVSIDLFQGTNPQTGELSGKRWLQIYEYAAPKGIDPTVARSRLLDVLTLAPPLLGVKEQDTFLRVRRREKGGSQYASEAKHTSAFTRTRKDGRIPLPEGAHLIDEGGLVFEVNFSSRLDCGIFLDHRETRAMVREMAKQTKGSKRFLNLFAYTGTATCYAADGGMRYTTTVDLSKPSLDWARRNMGRNGFVGDEHEFVQADVVSWVREQRRTKNRWDLVFCDVPTFSNSNRMGRRTFDVQRDHAELLIGVSRLLTRNGMCVFSCNLRSFKPDEATLRKAGVEIEDITGQTIPEDFARNTRIHHAYLVRRTPAPASRP